MCCLNVPFSFALGWLLFNLDSEDDDDSDLMKWLKLVTFYFWLLFLIPIDLVLLPINLLYALVLICFESELQEHNFYVVIIRENCWDPTSSNLTQQTSTVPVTELRRSRVDSLMDV